MAIDKTEAVVLRRTEYSNTSLIVSLYTRDFGRIEVMAKGARRETSPFHAVLDLANRVQAVYYRHVHGNIHTLSECYLTDDFHGLRSDLFRFYAASHVLELMSGLTAAEDPNPDLFDLLVSGISALSGGPEPSDILLVFQTDLLRMLGYLPVFFECASCGKDVLSAKRVIFSSVKGGALCGGCARGVSDGFGISGGLLGKLKKLSGLNPWEAESADLTAGDRKNLEMVLIRYFSCLLERELRTAKFVLGTAR
jgi:DNA repair protein RecO (recombination protein O)